MDEKLKHRLIGAAVLVALAVIILPILFTHADHQVSETRAVFDVPVAPDQPVVKAVQLEPLSFQESNKPAVAQQQHATPTEVSVRETVVSKPVLVAKSAKQSERIVHEATVKKVVIAAKPAAQPKRIVRKPAVKKAVVAAKSTPRPKRVVHKARTKKVIVAAKPSTPPKRSVRKVAVKKPIIAAKPITQPKHAVRKAATGRPVAAAKPAARPSQKRWAVQLASFGKKANAIALKNTLRQRHFSVYMHQRKTQGGTTIYQVFVGPYGQRTHSEAALKKLQGVTRMKGFVTTYKPTA